MRRLLAVVTILALAGCTPTPTDSYGDDGGLTLSVVQSRDDHGARIVGIALHSDRSDDIDVTLATLETPQLSDAAVWNRGTTLRAGLTIALRVQLPEPVCPLADDITPTVTVSFITEAGVKRTISAVPDQPSGTLTAISREDCIVAALNAQAEVTVSGLEYTPGAHTPATLVIGMKPRPVDGSVTIVSIGATVLLGLSSPEGEYTQRYSVDRVVARGGDDSDLRIGLVPNRCDTHAIAEDKRGTFIPLELDTADGLHGIYYIAMTNEEKNEIYDFIRDYCGLT